MCHACHVPRNSSCFSSANWMKHWFIVAWSSDDGFAGLFPGKMACLTWEFCTGGRESHRWSNNLNWCLRAKARTIVRAAHYFMPCRNNRMCPVSCSFLFVFRPACYCYFCCSTPARCAMLAHDTSAGSSPNALPGKVCRNVCILHCCCETVLVSICETIICARSAITFRDGSRSNFCLLVPICETIICGRSKITFRNVSQSNFCCLVVFVTNYAHFAKS